MSEPARRVLSLAQKELLQIRRDPASLIVVFVLPAVLLGLFGAAVSLDLRQVPVGVCLQDGGEKARSLAAALEGSPYLAPVFGTEQRLTEGLVAGRLRGMLTVRADFSAQLAVGQPGRALSLVTDGSQPNTAAFVQGYVSGAVQSWLAAQGARPPLQLSSRLWFNPSAESKNSIVPGAMGLVMTMIGTLLTALVLAREWERGTMEGLLSTPATGAEILIAKLLPYYLLGLIVCLSSAAIARYGFSVPFRGSFFGLMALSSAFLVPALAQGLLISAVTKSQFLGSIVAILSAFLPAFLLSGFLFDIASMPAPIRALTYILPVRYYVQSIQTVFLVGDDWAQFIPNIGRMLGIGLLLLFIANKKSPADLEGLR